MKITQQLLEVALGASPVDHPTDCGTIVMVAAENGLKLSHTQAETIWLRYSDVRCAGWLNVSQGEEVMEAIQEFVGARLRDLNDELEKYES